MKKGIIAISLLLSGALLITPITNASNAKNESQEVKVEQTTTSEKTDLLNETNDKTTQTEDVKEEIVKEEQNTESKDETPVKEEVNNPSNETVTNEDNKEEEVAEESGMSKTAAESILNKYITNVEQADFTYAYQGDENTFEAIQAKGLRGYVFLPNIETDMAYLVDKDNGSIYYFHPSGYFQQLQ